MLPWVKDQISGARNSWRNSDFSKKLTNGLQKNCDNMAGSSKEAESFILNIISQGNLLHVAATTEFTVEKVKSIATEHFYGHDKNKTPADFSLIHVGLCKPLEDKNSLKEEEVTVSNELLLVEVRNSIAKMPASEPNLKGPTREEIHEATKNLILRNPKEQTTPLDCSADFQDEIRKILIALVKASAKLIVNGTEAQQFYEILKDKLSRPMKADPNSVKYLVDMGFSKKMVLTALRLKKLNTTEALEWLLEHRDDPGVENLELETLETTLTKEGLLSMTEETPQEIPIVRIVDVLLDVFQQRQKLLFKPDQNIIQSLENMGFERSKIIESLFITGNNQTNACEWLLGERRPSLQYLNGELDPDNPIFIAIMENAFIQYSLINPKMLHAYLSMVESPSSTSVWMKDAEVSPFLSQIFKTYHAEKHAIHMNRYKDS